MRQPKKTEARPDEERRVAELLRVNAELAAELRDLALGRADAPRPAQLPAARRVAILQDERDSLARELEATRAELGAVVAERDDVGAERDAVGAERDGLRRHQGELEREVARLRGGFGGLIRRARARILRS